MLKQTKAKEGKLCEERMSDTRIAVSSEQSGALKTRAGLSVAVGGLSGFSRNRVSDTFLSPRDECLNVEVFFTLEDVRGKLAR